MESKAFVSADLGRQLDELQGLSLALGWRWWLQLILEALLHEELCGLVCGSGIGTDLRGHKKGNGTGRREKAVVMVCSRRRFDDKILK